MRVYFKPDSCLRLYVIFILVGCFAGAEQILCKKLRPVYKNIRVEDCVITKDQSSGLSEEIHLETTKKYDALLENNRQNIKTLPPLLRKSNPLTGAPPPTGLGSSINRQQNEKPLFSLPSEEAPVLNHNKEAISENHRKTFSESHRKEVHKDHNEDYLANQREFSENQKDFPSIKDSIGSVSTRLPDEENFNGRITSHQYSRTSHKLSTEKNVGLSQSELHRDISSNGSFQRVSPKINATEEIINIKQEPVRKTLRNQNRVSSERPTVIDVKEVLPSKETVRSSNPYTSQEEFQRQSGGNVQSSISNCNGYVRKPLVNEKSHSTLPPKILTNLKDSTVRSTTIESSSDFVFPTEKTTMSSSTENTTSNSANITGKVVLDNRNVVDAPINDCPGKQIRGPDGVCSEQF